MYTHTGQCLGFSVAGTVLTRRGREGPKIYVARGAGRPKWTAWRRGADDADDSSRGRLIHTVEHDVETCLGNGSNGALP